MRTNAIARLISLACLGFASATTAFAQAPGQRELNFCITNNQNAFKSATTAQEAAYANILNGLKNPNAGTRFEEVTRVNGEIKRDALALKQRTDSAVNSATTIQAKYDACQAGQTPFDGLRSKALAHRTAVDTVVRSLNAPAKK